MRIPRLPLLAALLLPVLVTVADPIRIVHGDWAEGTALAHLAAAVLEEEMELETTLTIAGPEATFPDIQEGRQDVFLTAWLPYTHAQYWRGHSTHIEKLGTVFRKAQTGLAVPTYVSINSIRQLNDHADKIARPGFTKDQPEAAAFLAKFALTDAQLNQLLLDIEASDQEPSAIAREWIAKHPKIVKAWTAPEKGFWRRLF